jgi:hypothetical protein
LRDEVLVVSAPPREDEYGALKRDEDEGREEKLALARPSDDDLSDWGGVSAPERADDRGGVLALLILPTDDDL